MVKHLYHEGHYVLVWSRETRKWKTRAVGPFVFRKYIGERGENAEVVQLGSGKIREVSLGNLLPMHPATQAVCLQTLEEHAYQTGGYTAGEDTDDISIDSESSISDPPGVIPVNLVLHGAPWPHHLS